MDQTISLANFDSFARKGRLGECRAFLDALHGVAGASADYLYAKAMLHSRMSEFERVLEVCAEIDGRHPQFVNHRYVMGGAAAHVGDVRPVVTALEKWRSYPRWQDVQYRAESLHLIGWDDDIIALAQDFDEQDFHATVARMIRAQSLMRRYGITVGLPEYAASWTTPQAYGVLYRMEPTHFRDYWYGELALPDAMRYMSARGGYGDYFMWQRYLPHLQAAGVRVDVQLGAVRTFSTRPIGARAAARARDRLGVGTGDARGDDSMWVDPFTLFTGLFPLVGYAERQGGTLEADPTPETDSMLKGIRAKAGGRPCIAVSWSANESDSTTFALKSLTVHQMLPLLARSDIHWVVLQRGLQRDTWLAHEASGATTVLDPGLSWEQTAALVAGVDAVVTIDTALAHLAGGLARPTYVLLNNACDWRWESMTNSTPWYATMRLVRQPELGDWAGAVERLASELAGWMAAA